MNADRNGNQQYRIEGNTVRKMETAPQRDERFGRNMDTSRERAERRRREQLDTMSAGNLVALTLATILLFTACVVYVALQSSVNTRMNHISAMEGQILNLKTENDAAYKRLETSVDLGLIKEQAVKELGMVYPSEDQIIYYTIDKSDYMEQYEEVPELQQKTLLDLLWD